MNTKQRARKGLFRAEWTTQIINEGIILRMKVLFSHTYAYILILLLIIKYAWKNLLIPSFEGTFEGT